MDLETGSFKGIQERRTTMYLAELKGKLSSNIEASEDILTSNVFSFFKYSNRQIYLNRFLESIGVRVSHVDLNNAEFQFWPCYPDGTEPDVVIVIGKYYILIEAKFGSAFGEESKEKDAQLKRELAGGLTAADELGKVFVLVALTADSTFMKWKAGVEVDVIETSYFRWINWQSVAKLLLEVRNNEDVELNDQEFASDLLALLDKKNLRGFQSFRPPLYNYKPREHIFFSFATAIYRGRFIGFKQLIRQYSKVKPFRTGIFYGKVYFTRLKQSQQSILPANKIFYDKGR